MFQMRIRVCNTLIRFFEIGCFFLQGCHGQGKKSGKQNFFQVREKSGNFNFSQGNLEKVVKVREFENFHKSSKLKGF